jgi:hypothetical protein
MMRHAFAIEHPDGGAWVLWCQSHNGYFMLLAGAWATQAAAERTAQGFGYDLVDSTRGILLVTQQMLEQPELYSQAAIVRPADKRLN